MRGGRRQGASEWVSEPGMSSSALHHALGCCRGAALLDNQRLPGVVASSSWLLALIRKLPDLADSIPGLQITA